MTFFKRHLPIVLVLSLTALYLFTRLFNILGLPIFTDEAIYIRWSQIALNDASWRFISLTDGKQPLFVWIAMILLKVIDDPLLAGRLVSVIAGAATAVGLFFMTKEIFKSQKTALLAVFFYILFPFALVYDRIALYDSLVAAFIIWSLYFEILLVKHIRLDLALILGMIVGAGMLTKTSADFALILLPFSLILFNFKSKNYKPNLIRWIIYSLVASILAIIIYSILRLSPFFYIIEQKNYLFIYSPQEWLSHPFTYLINNLTTFVNWLIGYATIPFIVLVVVSPFISYKFNKEKALITLWFLIPLIATALFGKLLYPRFLLFMTIPLIALAAFSFNELIQKAKSFPIKLVFALCFTILFLINDFYIISNFSNAPIPQADKGQFITGWPSGVGVSESIKFFTGEAKNKKIFIATQGTFGLMPYALEIFLNKNPDIQIKGFWPIKESPPQEVLEISKKMPTYFIFYQDCKPCGAIGIAPTSWPVTKIFQIEKFEKGQFYTLYQINPQ